MKLTLEISKDDLVQLLVALKDNTQVNINMRDLDNDVDRQEQLQAMLRRPMLDFEDELSVRAINALSHLTVGDLVSKKESDLLRMRNIGHNTYNEICEWVESKGLHFGYKKIE